MSVSFFLSRAKFLNLTTSVSDWFLFDFSSSIQPYASDMKFLVNFGVLCGFFGGNLGSLWETILRSHWGYSGGHFGGNLGGPFDGNMGITLGIILGLSGSTLGSP